MQPCAWEGVLAKDVPNLAGDDVCTWYSVNFPPGEGSLDTETRLMVFFSLTTKPLETKLERFFPASAGLSCPRL